MSEETSLTGELDSLNNPLQITLERGEGKSFAVLLKGRRPMFCTTLGDALTYLETTFPDLIGDSEAIAKRFGPDVKSEGLDGLPDPKPDEKDDTDSPGVLRLFAGSR